MPNSKRCASVVFRIRGLCGPGGGRQGTPWIPPCRLGDRHPIHSRRKRSILYTWYTRRTATRVDHRPLSALVLIGALSACGGGGGGSNPAGAASGTEYAVTVTAAPDFSSGATSVINTDPPRLARNDLVPTLSDLAVACQGDAFYRIERFNADNVTKFRVDTPDQVVYQYSTQDPGDTVSSNPVTLVFVEPRKAYLLRYGSPRAWIVDPSAGTEAGFKLGELDLGAYADADGVPEMQAGVIVDGRLYIVMQRFESFITLKTAYVAVFDVATDQEIDTGKGAADGLKGIPLRVKNPLSIHYLPDSGLIYVQAVGRFAFGASPAEYSGGVESLDPVGFETRLVLDDGDASDHPFGQVLALALVSATQGYFIGTAGFEDNTLYRFDPGTGQVRSDVNGPLAIAGLFGQNLTHLALDRNARLWVGSGDPAAPGMVVLDTRSDSIETALIGTDLNPVQTCFALSH